MDYAGWLTDLTILAQVVMIDVALAGDNAVVVGLAVAGLPMHRRRPAILLGIGGATVLRILLGAVALRLLDIIGLTFAGGLLLLWVCWRMFRELRATQHAHADERPEKSLRQAMVQIIVADLSMSVDNVLAVAGAAQGHPWVLVAGLLFSVVLMGAAATVIARLLDRFRWIGWIGLLIVLHVAIEMIWTGGWNVFGTLP
ncbi:MAG: TerC family protein [Acetobacteraceae bacterium]|jgi:YjbE family integral membrane protein